MTGSAGMSPDDEGFIFEEIRGIAPAEVEVPPDRHAFPAWAVEELEQRTLVTVGGPGWWMVDELIIVGTSDQREDDQTWYEVMPLAEWGASLLREDRADGKHVVVPWAVPASDLWVYRDAPGEPGSADELAPPDPVAWLGRVTESTDQPPPVLTPRPARELPSLIGRRLRVRAPNGWFWMMGLSEPLQDGGGDIAMTLCLPADYWRAAFGRPKVGQDWMRRYPLHWVWTY